MAEAARIATGEGADIIDINMGCPAKKVTGGYAGSALMRDLDHAVSLIDAVVGAVDVPVTLKMRLGWDESALNAPVLARRAEDAGVGMVTVHGRTRCQFYEGKADWRAIRARQGRCVHPRGRQWRHLHPGRRGGGAGAIRRRRGDGGAREFWRALDRRPDCRGRRRRASSGWGATRRLCRRRTTRTCWLSTAPRAGCARRASIWDGISTGTRLARKPACDPRFCGRSIRPRQSPACAALSSWRRSRMTFGARHECAPAAPRGCGRCPDRAQHDPPPGDHDRRGRAYQLCQCRRRGLLPLQRGNAVARHAGAFRAVRQPAS